MKKVNFAKAIAAGMGAAALGMLASPSGQQVTEQTARHLNEGAQVEQKAPNRSVNQQQQQAQNRTQGTVNHRFINSNMPYFPGTVTIDDGIPPKVYGEWLMRTGKDKYNKRCRKHIAKGIA